MDIHSKSLASTTVEKQDFNIHNVGADRPVTFMCTRKQERKAGQKGEMREKEIKGVN